MISVCMASYNGEKYIKEQIESIISQLGPGDELIISDDGSKDQSVEIVKTFGDNRIKIVRNKKPHGFVGNFENALSYAKGDYILLCDQDDIWMPNKVKVVLDALSDCDLVIHDAELIDAEGKWLGQNYYSTMHNGNGFWKNLFYPRYLGCCMAFRKGVLKKSLPFPNYHRGHDYWIGCITSVSQRVKFIPDKLIAYRRHGDNVTSSSERSERPILIKAYKRVEMLYSVIKRTLKMG